MSEDIANCSICRQPLDANGRCAQCDDIARVWTVRDWRPLLTLTMVIVLGFSFTRLVVGLYQQKQNSLAEEYYGAGLRAMDANRAAEAVDDFETALVYSRDNFQYRLKLTDALLATGARGEAMAQLRAFWEQRPGDAQVNLKLARLEVARKHPEAAVRYYQNAIEGVWPERTDPVPQRIAVRFEESEYLVNLGIHEQAEAALLALQAVLPESSPLQAKLGELFLRNGDPDRAAGAFAAWRRQEPHNQDAIWAQAQAAFAEHNFTAALHFLDEMKPETEQSREMRMKLDRMEALDPFSLNSVGRIRRERIVADFRIALDRLAGCGLAFAQAIEKGTQPLPSTDPQWSNLENWAAQLAPMMSERKLRGRDDVIESAMRFVFQAETATQNGCGRPALNDEALLLLARERMGSGQ